MSEVLYHLESFLTQKIPSPVFEGAEVWKASTEGTTLVFSGSEVANFDFYSAVGIKADKIKEQTQTLVFADPNPDNSAAFILVSVANTKFAAIATEHLGYCPRFLLFSFPVVNRYLTVNLAVLALGDAEKPYTGADCRTGIIELDGISLSPARRLAVLRQYKRYGMWRFMTVQALQSKGLLQTETCEDCGNHMNATVGPYQTQTNRRH